MVYRVGFSEFLESFRLLGPWLLPYGLLGVVPTVLHTVAWAADGKISLPLLNDVQAAGLTPPQLRERLTELAQKYLEDPNVTIVVRQINSRKVFITGQVNRAGTYPLSGPTTVMQMLATAGGLHEFADKKNIRILRTENGKQIALRFNYKDVRQGKNLKQNIELKPGDTIIVP
jgi:polysaccharide export outer membrane protein